MAAWLTLPALTTREVVTQALDVASTSRPAALIDRYVEAATVDVQTLCHRRFTPLQATRYWDWPARVPGPSWRLWLGEHEIISLTALVAGGVTISSADYFLEPANDGPPYDRIDIDLSSSAAFASSSGTFQRAVAATGLFGYTDNQAAAGALAAAVASTSATSVTVTDSGAAGVGDMISIDSERMVVADKAMATTGQTLQTPLTASAANTSVAVTDGTAYAEGELLQLDSERMLITSITGNTLTVRRAADGTALAAHTAPTIYAARSWTVRRGAAGSTAATHLISTAITRWVPPALARELATARSTSLLLGQSTGWARPAGAGASQRPQPGSVEDLAARCFAAHGRIRSDAA